MVMMISHLAPLCGVAQRSVRSAATALLRSASAAAATTSNASQRGAAANAAPATRSFSTVADDEVHKFNSVATDWWAPESTTGVGALHQLNPVRVKYIRSHVIEHFGGDEHDPEPLKPFRVADIGCGGGILSEALCRIGGSMVSVDPGSENIGAAKRHASQNRVTSAIDYRCCTSDDLVAQGEQFDIVCSLEVVEHVTDVKAFVQTLTPLVKPGGLLFMSTINRNPLAAALAVGMAEYVLGLLPPGTHDWRKFVQPEELQAILKEEGFVVKDTSGIVGEPVFRSWRIDPNCTAINYILCAHKPQY
uniref:Ubiquinone biosynthesis O-methyltransferase, mitochondrial n=1 Tax=Globisporangium ultimum (strain ATCC 200006 / CBS 805.95 / DAOM BR144) TaxID=431595 RepID=K3WUN9_GLOUD